jgi:Domain of unknown function (DUF4157)
MFDTRQLKNAPKPDTQVQNAAESSFAPNVIARKPFADDRQEAVAQRKLQAGIQQSPQVQALAQLQAIAGGKSQAQAGPQQRKNETGLPDQLKSGIESMSGMDMSDVRVHYGSDKPAQLQAHAYAQGNDIHLGPGQEQHLAHEAWHVVQQRQGRVQPTKQLKGKTAINDDAGLEREADVMGAKAMQMKGDGAQITQMKASNTGNQTATIQRQKHCWDIDLQFLRLGFYSNLPGSCAANIVNLFRLMRDSQRYSIPTSEMEVVLMVWMCDNHTQNAAAQDHTALILHLEEGTFVLDPTIDQFGGHFGVFFDTLDNWENTVKQEAANNATVSDFEIHRNATPFSDFRMRNLTFAYEANHKKTS